MFDILSMAGESALPDVAITTEMLDPLVTGISANLGVIIPVGIALMAIMYGPKLIPKIISLFTDN